MFSSEKKIIFLKKCTGTGVYGILQIDRFEKGGIFSFVK